MIGFVTGKIISINGEAKELLVMTSGGVGYAIKADTVSHLVGSQVDLYIYTAVSENNISLWGFTNAEQLKLFRLLLSVSGVGPSSAANLLFHLPVSEVVSSIINAQPERLKSPGLGVKTAQKIVLELNTKITNYPELVNQSSQTQNDAGQAQLNNTEMIEAVAALTALGYDANEVRKYFRSQNSFGSAAELVKIFLSRKAS